MMIKNKVYGLLIVLVPVIFCMAAPVGAQSFSPGIYRVFGRVVDTADKPVGNCNVVLTRRKIIEGEEKTAETVSETVIAVTDQGGNYMFAFEPLQEDNFWLSFITEGYYTRMEELDPHLEGYFFNKPNKSTVRVNVILEKEQ